MRGVGLDIILHTIFHALNASGWKFSFANYRGMLQRNPQRLVRLGDDGINIEVFIELFGEFFELLIVRHFVVDHE